MNERIFDLPCMDNRKSFYGKAQIIERNGEKLLKSYETIVCKIDANGCFIRLWNGYSATTMRHVNSFCSFYNVNGGGKKWWDSLEAETATGTAGRTLTNRESYAAMMNRRYAG